MATNSEAQVYIDAVVSLLGPITFDGTTLAAAGLINDYAKSVKDTPNTLIRVFALGGIRSEKFETNRSQRIRPIFVDIRTYALNRELVAQDDLNYLEESILGKLEPELKNAAWCDGVLGLEELSFEAAPFEQNYYRSILSMDIFKWVNSVVNN